ncbi:acyl carrier protein [Kitasatospora sp. NPDC089509]|uniref:acyl carrier protein n=1 Tax=Kitasatospora sp. NPDC089509 TaxID=3364079 RepID=UPI003818F610
MTLERLQDILRECAGEEGGAEPFAATADQDFADLGYDSLALLEAQSRIEREYGMELSELDLSEVRTPRALVEFVNHASS